MQTRRFTTQPYLGNPSGFTLIEMLVVIAIIAILAGVLFTAGSTAINAAKRAKANVVANEIDTAIVNYYTEYGVYPVPPNTTTDLLLPDSSGAGQVGLMYALCGNINASTGVQGTSSTTSVPNTRQIAYLTPKRSDVDANGVLINPFSSRSAPTYFNICMDSDYNGICGNGVAPLLPDFNSWATGTAYSSAPTLANGTTQPVAVWANCDPRSPNDATSKAPNFWVHTY